MTQREKERIECILKQMQELTKNMYRDDIDEEDGFVFNDIFKNIKGYHHFNNGATKIVFFFDRLNYVFKIPITISDEYNYYDYDVDVDSFRYECGGGPNGDNYCELEYDIYQMSKEEHLEKFFAPIEMKSYICDDGCPIYVQKKVDCTEGSIYYYGPWYSYLKFNTKANKRKACNMNQYSDLPYDFIASCIKWYGIDETKNLCDFLEENVINDLRWGNLGCDKYGKPIIFDYSGYSG